MYCVRMFENEYPVFQKRRVVEKQCLFFYVHMMLKKKYCVNIFRYHASMKVLNI